MIKKIFILLIFVLTVNIDSALAENFKKDDDPKFGQTKYLSSRLERLYKLNVENKEYFQFARKSDIEIIEDRVVVAVLTKPGITTADIDENILKTFGAKIQAKAKHSMSVEIPISELVNVSTAIEGLAEIRLPLKPVADIISEGVALMNADAWHAAGDSGTGVKIAVIDLGFDSLTEAQANGDIPSSSVGRDLTGGGNIETTTPHGTAVTEAIFDLVPNADFYLYKIANQTHFENAVDSCIRNGVDIINHSCGWFNALGYYDGTGLICSNVDSAISHGILWVNSAGNSARHHYRSDFSGNVSGYHEFSGTDTINPTGPYPAGMSVTIKMNWDEYPSTAQDYDLYLARDTGDVSPKWVIVDSSTNRQDGTGPSLTDYPEESITFDNSVASSTYGILVKKYSATTNVDFTLFSLGGSIGYYTVSSSLPDPGTVTDVVTVGAINRTVYNTTEAIEPFSSQGPTTDGRIKPDVAAPDYCSSFTYRNLGAGYWSGTSLSSPHTAGVCALIKSHFPGYNDSVVRNYLYTNCTVDLGDAGKDNIYGWGKVVMPDIAITVTSPSGGENWYIDSINNITWTSSGTSGGVKIEYSTDSGASWSDVIASMPDTGAYPWTVPNTPSDSCLVRITDTTGSPSDTSDALFSISHPIPDITVTSPNGEEIWYIDSTYNIIWTSFATSGGVKIEYSTDNGSNWSEIITGKPADTLAYVWTIPNTPSDSCLVRITDTTGSPSDTSDAIFTISPTSGIPTSGAPRVYSMVVKTIAVGNQLEVKYGLPEKADVRFDIYDIKGTKLGEISEEHTPGFYSIKISMTDKPAGVYFLIMAANKNKFIESRKVILVK